MGPLTNKVKFYLESGFKNFLLVLNPLENSLSECDLISFIDDLIGQRNNSLRMTNNYELIFGLNPEMIHPLSRFNLISFAEEPNFIEKRLIESIS